MDMVLDDPKPHSGKTSIHSLVQHLAILAIIVINISPFPPSLSSNPPGFVFGCLTQGVAEPPYLAWGGLAAPRPAGLGVAEPP
jgi:hypothetical protein